MEAKASPGRRRAACVRVRAVWGEQRTREAGSEKRVHRPRRGAVSSWDFGL